MEFYCPVCGGNYFGTSNAQDWDVAEGHCHGDVSACSFSWPRSDDWKYFRNDPSRPFSSKEEYEAAEGITDELLN